jgi:hypothetical protein
VDGPRSLHIVAEHEVEDGVGGGVIGTPPVGYRARLEVGHGEVDEIRAELDPDAREAVDRVKRRRNAPEPALVGVETGNGEASYPENPGGRRLRPWFHQCFYGGRGGFRTCDLSRVKRALSH